jgi:Fe-Mn family superoxide dismutase
MASVVLHELYFGNLTGERKALDDMLVTELEEHFGGVERWRREFLGIAQALGA